MESGSERIEHAQKGAVSDIKNVGLDRVTSPDLQDLGDDASCEK